MVDLDGFGEFFDLGDYCLYLILDELTYKMDIPELLFGFGE